MAQDGREELAMPKKTALAVYQKSRRWTEDEARAALARLDASGLSVAAFAAREGLDDQRFYWWRRRLGVAKKPTGKFVEITGMRAVVAEQVEVVLLSDRVLRFSATLDCSVLRRLVETLEDERC